jgi:tetratricopeptide (TPR) repeat protein
MIFGTCVSWILSADHRRRPMALQTGLTDVYGAYVVENGEEIFGQPVRGWTSRLQRAEANSLNNAETFLKIEDLLSVKDINAVADVHGVSMFHVESWGFAHFLLFSKDMAKDRAMDRLLNAFAHHRSAHDALREAFGEGADTINSRFRAYIHGGDFYEITLPVEQAPLAGPPVPADPAVVASLLSRLESSAKNLDVARAYAEQAIRLAPTDPRAREALALVDFLAHRSVETAADCQEAIRLGTRDGWTWHEASTVIGRTDAAAPGPGHVHLTAEQARAAIDDEERAILLSKGLENAYARVAALIATADKVTEDDGKFLVLGRNIFPNNGWIEIGQAQWAHRANDDALALKILGDVQARSAAFTPEEIDRARALQSKLSGGPG